MKALFLKDLFVSRKYLKTLVMLLAFYIVIAVMMKDAAFISGCCVFITLLFLMTSFAYDETAKWDAYALSMPVSINSIVGSKFLILFVSVLAGALSSLLGALLLSLLSISPLQADSFWAIAACTAVALLLGFLFIPVVIRFGTERCRVIIICLFLLPTAGIFVLQYFNISISTDALMSMLPTLFALSPLILLGFGILSFLVSRHFYRIKEY